MTRHAVTSETVALLWTHTSDRRSLHQDLATSPSIPSQYHPPDRRSVPPETKGWGGIFPIVPVRPSAPNDSPHLRSKTPTPSIDHYRLRRSTNAVNTRLPEPPSNDVVPFSGRSNQGRDYYGLQLLAIDNWCLRATPSREKEGGLFVGDVAPRRFEIDY